MNSYIFIRNSLTADDLFSAVEEYIRNYRGPDDNGAYSREASFSSLCYRFPYRNKLPKWKLIRDNNQKDGVLTIVSSSADNFKYNITPFRHVDMKKLIQACDTPKHETIAGSAFLGITTFGNDQEMLQSLRLMTKNNDGRLVDWDTGEILYPDAPSIEHDYSKHKYITWILAGAFKLGKLPIYVVVLNNSMIINKVLFVNEMDDMAIFAENESVGRIRDTIFSPMFSEAVTTINTDKLLVSGDTFTLNMFGCREWDSFNGIQTEGSEIALEDLPLPPINDSIKIETSLEWEFVDEGQIKFTLKKNIGYIKITIDTGPFFTDCVLPIDNFRYEFLVHKEI